jgi:RNA polymerase sigma-70 factor, ECF subfamily
MDCLPDKLQTTWHRQMQPESIAKQLWRKASQGDQAAYEELFSQHVDRLMIYIRARMGNQLRARIEPADVLQDAYLAAHRAFATFEYTTEGSFFHWICRIVNNRLRDAADHFSAKKRQPEELIISWPTGPQTAVARAESRQHLEQALQQLSLEHRDVILFRYFEGLSAEETGVRMNRSAGAVRNLLSRALVELGKQMKPFEQDSKP